MDRSLRDWVLSDEAVAKMGHLGCCGSTNEIPGFAHSEEQHHARHEGLLRSAARIV